MTFNQEIVIVLLLFSVTFVIVLPLVCVELGFSWYFKQSMVNGNTIDNDNEQRVRKVQQTLKHLVPSTCNTKHNNSISNKNILDFSIVIVSTGRRCNPHYLLQSAIRLFTEIQKDNGYSRIAIFNVDDHPDANTDAKLLSPFIKVVNRSTPLTMDTIFEKEKVDYIDAIQIGLQSNSRYILIVQDDALAMKDILWRIRFLLKWKMPWTWLRAENHQWAFLKLYYPEKWQGYSNTEIPELLLIGILGALCFTVFRQKLSKSKRKLGKKQMWLWYISGFLYFLLFAHAIGRAHWIEIRKFAPILYSIGKDFGCCIPAVLFPSQEAKYFVEFLNKTKCAPDYPLDFAFEDFTKSTGLKGLLVTPNLFNHIGYHSSLHSYDKNTREFKLLFAP